jgi:hypothetical protein
MTLLHFQNPERCSLGCKNFLQGLALQAIAVAQLSIKVTSTCQWCLIGVTPSLLGILYQYLVTDIPAFGKAVHVFMSLPFACQKLAFLLLLEANACSAS